MSISNQQNLRIHDSPEQQSLSAAQKQFNGLIKKIDAKKKRLAEWQETIPRYQQQVASEYHVLLDAYNAQRGELAHLLDNAYYDTRFKHADKAKIQHIIVDLTLDLIAGHGKDELKGLYNKHSDSDFDEENEAQEAAVLKAMKVQFKKLYGIDIDDGEDVGSPEKMQAVLQEKLQEKLDRKTAKQRKREEKNPPEKTPQQLETEAREQEEQKNLSKSIQAVFRQLAAVLHPDREQDEVERERKTKLMQQVNVAYGKKDLLRLLELQLQVEQIDQAQLNNMSEERLKYFNQILQNQLQELQDEIADLTQGFNGQQQANLSPQKLLHDLDMNIRNMQRSIVRLKADMAAFQSAPVLKNWLKGYRIPR